MNYNITVDLMKGMGARVADVDGYRCVCIPIDPASGHLVVDGAACLLKMTAFQVSGCDGQTHLIKAMLSRDKLSRLTPQERRSLPFIGNMRPWSSVSTETPDSPDK